MKRKIIILLAIIFIVSVSAIAFISDVNTDTMRIKASGHFDKSSEKKDKDDDETDMANTSLPKSKLTLVILFLGGIGLAVFRRNSLV